MTDARERLRQIIKAESLLTGGAFTLASGRPSGYFFDMKKTMLHPEGMALAADLIIEAIADLPEVRFVGGLEVGAIPLVAAVAVRSWPKRPLQGFFVRKEPKGHGTNKVIDGRLEPGAPVVLFEDVTTTGGSVMKAVNAVRAEGCTVARIVTIVDRLEGARDNLAREGIPLAALFTREDFA